MPWLVCHAGASTPSSSSRTCTTEMTALPCAICRWRHEVLPPAPGDDDPVSPEAHSNHCPSLARAMLMEALHTKPDPLWIDILQTARCCRGQILDHVQEPLFEIPLRGMRKIATNAHFGPGLPLLLRPYGAGPRRMRWCLATAHVPQGGAQYVAGAGGLRCLDARRCPPASGSGGRLNYLVIDAQLQNRSRYYTFRD